MSKSGAEQKPEDNPSMEQILQTIRGVIAGDQPDVANTQGSVLELTEVVSEDGSIQTLKSSKPDVLNNIDQALGTKPAETPQAQPAATIQPAMPPVVEAKAEAIANTNITNEEHIKKLNSLLSDTTAVESSKALKSLVKSVSKPSSDGLSFRSGNTVEDLVIESIKPYMKDWLDRNLPTIVKSLVEKEIKKLIPRDDE